MRAQTPDPTDRGLVPRAGALAHRRRGIETRYLPPPDTARSERDCGWAFLEEKLGFSFHGAAGSCGNGG
eukprot:3380281-Rhodomonas_salina.2